MSDANTLVRLIKQTALDAVEASKPMKVVYGTVQSTGPLTVITEQQLLLSAVQLVLTKTASDAALAKGDKVVMIRQQGGQRFVVLDKVG